MYYFSKKRKLVWTGETKITLISNTSSTCPYLYSNNTVISSQHLIKSKLLYQSVKYDEKYSVSSIKMYAFVILVIIHIKCGVISTSWDSPLNTTTDQLYIYILYS